jgi:hypothetical protein
MSSVQGQSRHFNCAPTSSGLARLADIIRIIRHVSKVPNSGLKAYSRRTAHLALHRFAVAGNGYHRRFLEIERAPILLR